MKQTENILFIVPHFPPMGGPGVHRSLQFVKRLPTLGYKPFVLTIREEDIVNGSYPLDETLLKQVPENIGVIRISSKEPRALIKLLTDLKIFRIFWFLFYPLFWEKSARWPRNAYGEAERIIRENNIKIIYSSSGPYSSILLANKLKKKLNVKWVADLRDPFTDAYMWHWPSKWHWLLCRYLEKKILNKADKLVVNTNDVKVLYAKRNIVPENKIVVITNGF